MKKLLFAATALIFLAGCEDTRIPAPPEPLQFSGMPYTLNVATIHIAQDYDAAHVLPHVEYRADISPADALRRWAQARLVAAGQGNSTLEVDIVDASIIKRDIPKEKTGIEGLFTKEQTEAYDGSVEVTLKIYDGRKVLPVATVDASAKESLTLSEDATSLDRQELYNTMTRKLLRSIQSELDRNIHQYFQKYLIQ